MSAARAAQHEAADPEQGFDWVAGYAALTLSAQEQAGALSAQQQAGALTLKASRPRKTPSFIEDHKRWERTTGEQHTRWTAMCSEDTDPRLGDGDEKEATLEKICAEVAAVIWRHYQDGDHRRVSRSPDPTDDEFHEEHFRRASIFNSCCPKRWLDRKKEVATEDRVRTLLFNLASGLYFCKQIIVLSLIYLEKLLEGNEGTLHITDGNWRSMVVGALMVASKVWEDVHPWNSDFERCLRDCYPGLWYKKEGLYKLESLFLQRLGWQVSINGETYAKYYFALMEDNTTPTSRFRQYSDPQDTQAFFETILEEEPTFEWQDLEEGSVRAMASMSRSPPLGPQRRPFDFTDRLGGGADGASLPTGLSSPLLGRRNRSGDRLSQSASSRSSPSPSRLSQSISFGEERLHYRSSSRGPSKGSVPSDSFSTKTIQEVWMLDKANPHVGHLRHAPRALAPSKQIQNSSDLLWEHHVASRTTTQMLGRTRSGGIGLAATLSGATGEELALEMQRYLNQKKVPGESNSNTISAAETRRQGREGRAGQSENRLDALFE